MSARPAAPRVQRLTMTWLPAPIANGSHGHWAAKARKLRDARDMAFAYARMADWRPVTGKARLDIVLVFDTDRRRDTDNLYARCKGLIDGIRMGGYIVDDSTDWLDLHVSARVEPGRKAVEMTLTEGAD